MTASPKADSASTVIHGQFYKADELVDLIYQDLGGFHPGARAVHANGQIYAGTFKATPAARTLSRAAHFQGNMVPVTTRFSGSSGDPEVTASGTVAMATRFYLPNGTVTDLIGITLPAFPVRTPDDVIGLLTAARPDQATGERDMGKLQGFLGSHPEAARVTELLKEWPAPVSFAQVSYRPLHAFRFVNEAGVARWARYHWEPEAGVAGQSPAEMAAKPHDFLFGELERRLKQGTVDFRLDLQMAQDGDPLDDPSAFWPEERERITVGRLELSRPITLDEIGDPLMMHDPTKVTDGIEISPDDQIMAARRGAYLVSAAKRSGGWQACPFGKRYASA
ncbi:MAG: catalase family peroxidase [Beijerinckiaceae bacterium]